ncbi:MAG: hypothetical protein QM778_08185 [Myxococcales bacterium]
MKQQLGRVLAWLSAVAAVVLLGVALDAVPSVTPEPPARVEFAARDLAQPVPDHAAPKKAPSDAGAPRPEPLKVWSFPVCEAPEKGARVYGLALGASQAAFVWCKGGYTRLDLSSVGELPQAQRGARFPSRAELPGGVTAHDFDADGVLDLVLATAPPPQVLHRPGAGAFLLRGRMAGGFEPARALVEAPVSAVAGLEVEGTGAAALAVLTRGDLTAQRPGELWLFAGGTSLTRVAQQPLGLGARDLVTARLMGSGRSLWAALPQAGKLAGVEFLAASGKLAWGPLQSVAFPAVQGLIGKGAGEPSSLLLARDTADVRRLEAQADALALTPWAEHVNVGPGLLVDLDGDSQPEVLAVVDGGVARVFPSLRSAPEELDLPAHALDVASVRDQTARERALVLVRESDTGWLSLLLLPSPPWSQGSQVELQRLEVADAAGQAVVALD